MESRMIAKAPPGEGCPRCGGYVYAAEQMLARGTVRLFFKCRCIKMPIIIIALLYINRYYNFKLFITVNIFFTSFKINNIIVQTLVLHQNYLLLYETNE